MDSVKQLTSPDARKKAFSLFEEFNDAGTKHLSLYPGVGDFNL